MMVTDKKISPYSLSKLMTWTDEHHAWFITIGYRHADKRGNVNISAASKLCPEENPTDKLRAVEQGKSNPKLWASWLTKLGGQTITEIAWFHGNALKFEAVSQEPQTRWWNTKANSDNRFLSFHWSELNARIVLERVLKKSQRGHMFLRESALWPIWRRWQGGSSGGFFMTGRANEHQDWWGRGFASLNRNGINPR